jgi:hypothetical protein
MSDLAWALTLLAVPLAVVLIDLAAALRRSRGRATSAAAPVEDFDVLVPIWGSVSYLTNLDYLAAYGDRVVLCTPRSGSEEFLDDLRRIADDYGFRVFLGDVAGGPGRRTGRRQTSGLIRDRLIRDAHAVLSRTYVVCIDADTRTREPLARLVGQMAYGRYDIVSVRVVPANVSNWLSRLQRYEYRAAMRLRLVMPWLVSGACHAGRRVAHREVMARHSLFFQGNDVEVGWLAERLGFRVGHVQYDVLTDVPTTPAGWWRQRVAWAGGEVRLFLANPQLVLRHPVLWTYFAVVTFALLPLRWAAVLHPGWPLAVTVLGYLAVLALVHRGHWDRWLPVYPLYAAVTSLVIVPLGVVAYIRMWSTHRNAGLIRVRRRSREVSALVTPARAGAARSA